MIEVKLKKSFVNGNETFQLDLDFKIKQGSLTAISGISGAGKTTLLRMIAGLEKPDAGTLSVNGNTWYSDEQKVDLKPQKRQVGMVFQEAALFPNMTVLENLHYTSNNNLDKIIQLTDIKDLKDRNITTLSGGQKQRVALARALAQQPEILLLDEPLSALDNTTRYALQQTLISVHKELGLTTLMVTHDQSEILRLADHMIYIEDGRITKAGEPIPLISGNQLSGKFQFQGDLIELKQEGILFIASVLIGNQVIQVVLDGIESEALEIGDKVVVASKAFNPIIKKIS